MHYGEHGVERRERERRERENRFHSRFGLQASIQWDIQAGVIKKRGRSNQTSGFELRGSGFGFWVSDFGLRGSGFGFRVSGVGTQPRDEPASA